MKLGDFIDRVCGEPYRASVSETSSLSESGRFQVRYILRKDKEGNDHIAIIQPAANRDTEVIAPVLRSLCNDLGIDPADFGVAEEE